MPGKAEIATGAMPDPPTTLQFHVRARDTTSGNAGGTLIVVLLVSVGCRDGLQCEGRNRR